MNLDEAKHYLNNQQQSPSFRLGITFLEDNHIFWGMSNSGNFHLYHYLEFLFMAFNVIQDEDFYQRFQFPFQLQWVHVPYMLRDQLKGGSGQGINQLITALAFQNDVTLKGLEDNDDIIRSLHDSYRGKMPFFQLMRMIWFNLLSRKRNGWKMIHRQAYIPSRAKRRENFHSMTNDVDVVLFIDRTRCDHQEPVVNQMLAKLSDNESAANAFPAQSWYDAISRGLLLLSQQNEGGRGESERQKALAISHQKTKNKKKKKLVVCYIDRQSSSRRMPPAEHEWLIDTLQQQQEQQKVEFHHLFMEQYSALEQITTARNCNMLVGVHGNGLSHQVFMKPSAASGGAASRSSYVVEFFWDMPRFVFCYSLLARIMGHQYLGFWNGRPLNTDLVFRKDPSIVSECHQDDPIRHSSITRGAFLDFLNQAIDESSSIHDE